MMHGDRKHRVDETASEEFGVLTIEDDVVKSQRGGVVERVV